MKLRPTCYGTGLKLSNDGHCRVLPIGPYDLIEILIMERKRYTEKWWSVSNGIGGSVLNKDGNWEFEPIPSSRDDAFFARCRYDTMEEAVEALRKAVKA